MNINELISIASIIKQKTDGQIDVSSWEMFVKNALINKKHIITISFIKNNNDICQTVNVCIYYGNMILGDGIIITDINKEECYDFYEELSSVSGIDKNILKSFL